MLKILNLFIGKKGLSIQVLYELCGIEENFSHADCVFGIDSSPFIQGYYIRPVGDIQHRVVAEFYGIEFGGKMDE